MTLSKFGFNMHCVNIVLSDNVESDNDLFCFLYLLFGGLIVKTDGKYYLCDGNFHEEIIFLPRNSSWVDILSTLDIVKSNREARDLASGHGLKKVPDGYNEFAFGKKVHRRLVYLYKEVLPTSEVL